MQDAEKILTVTGLSVRVAGKTLLQEISFDVNRNECVIVIGANGAGKTLLLKTLLGYVKPAAGSFKWKPGIRVGYVPQKFMLDKTLPITAREFLLLKGPATPGRMDEILSDVGLSKEFLDRNVGTLSGGQYQRLLIAWALIDTPDVLIFDEPTESIDVAGQSAIYELVDALKKNKGITIFMVSHDLDVVFQYADKVLCLAGERMVCSEDPRSALDRQKLEEVYGHGAKGHHH